MDRASEILQRYERIRRDPWAFLSTCVYTLDQVDKKNPVKQFPHYLDYFKIYTRLWHKYPKIAVPKSRRMTMSWTNVALYLWDTMFYVGRHNAIVSRKEEAADELISRAKFIYDHIPEEVIPRDLLPKMKDTYCKLEFEEINSLLEGFPQGADQLRQYTFSGLFGDESAFWEQAREFYSASYPTLEGGGRMTLVSSAGPGFFKEIVFDQLDNAGAAVEEIIPGPHKIWDTGIETWINPKNGFLVFQLHYSANPLKRDDEYRKSVKAGMPLAKYMQEYEIQWDSFMGMPVYPDFQEKLHGVRGRILPEAGLPLLRGWDFGLTPACVVAQLQGDSLKILWEMTAQNMGAKRFVPMALKQLKTIYPEWSDQRVDWLDFADPAGQQRKDTDEGTCFAIMVENGLNPKPGAISWEHRKGSVEHFLLKSSKEGPGLQIDMEWCPTLVRGFKGGYRYPDKAAEIEPENIRPVKDMHSHPHDALQMITCKFVENPKRRPSIPSPSYSWSNPQRKIEVQIG